MCVIVNELQYIRNIPSYLYLFDKILIRGPESIVLLQRLIQQNNFFPLSESIYKGPVLKLTLILVATYEEENRDC